MGGWGERSGGGKAHGKCSDASQERPASRSRTHTHDSEEQRVGTGKQSQSGHKQRGRRRRVGHDHQQRYSPAAARGFVTKPVVKGFGPTAGVKKACTPPRLLLPRWQTSRAALARRERVVVACMTTTKLQHKRTRLSWPHVWVGGGPVVEWRVGKGKRTVEMSAWLC